MKSQRSKKINKYNYFFLNVNFGLKCLLQLITVKLCQRALGKSFLDKSWLDAYKTDFLSLLQWKRSVLREQT